MTTANPVLNNPDFGQHQTQGTGQAADADTVVKSFPSMSTLPHQDAPQNRAKFFTSVAESDVENFMQNLDSAKVLLIPVGVTISCDLVTNGNAAVIAGHVIGNIDAGAGPIIIKDGGEVQGTVTSEEYVVVAGKVTSSTTDGNAVVTPGLWVLAETGHVKGTVAYGRHRAYEGGVFNGRAIPFNEFQTKA